MRGPGSVVTCVRTLSGEIFTRRETEILFSAGASGEDEEPLTGKEAALAAGSALFFMLPAAAVPFFPGEMGAARRNFSEGLLRLALFPGYIWSVSRRKEMRRVLEYHGAEHEAICCLEKRLPLTMANVRAQSRLHPRCGTNFLMMVMQFGLFAFSFFRGPPFYARVLLRFALLSVIAGQAYE